MLKKIFVICFSLFVFLSVFYGLYALIDLVFGKTVGYLYAVGVVLYACAHLYRVGKNTKTLDEGLKVIREYGVIDGYRIHHIPDVSCMGMLWSVALTGPKFILIDDAFLALPENVRSFIINHEAGHLVLGHDGVKENALKRMLKIWMGKVMKIELEADAFAAERVGRDAAIEALTVMKSGKGVSKSELNNRIKALQTA